MTSHHQAVGISSLLMNIMSLVPSTRPGIPCASHPSLLPYDAPHTFRFLGFFIRCLVYVSSPVSSYKTVLNICIGYFLLEILSGVTFSCSVSTPTSIASWVNDQKLVLLLVLYAGACHFSMTFLLVSSTLGKLLPSSLDIPLPRILVIVAGV